MITKKMFKQISCSIFAQILEAANQEKNSAMEAENHVKHGVGSKSLTSRGSMLIRFVSIVVLCISSSSIWAQEDSERSPGGLYIRIGGGYMFPVDVTNGIDKLSPAFPEQAVRSNSSANQNSGNSSSRTTRENIPVSLGKGLQYGFGIGYMFNRHIGFELNGDYFSGLIMNELKNSNHSNVTHPPSGGLYNPSTVTSSSEVFKIYRNSIIATPAIKLKAPINNAFALYSRIGISIPVSNKAFYEFENSWERRVTTGAGSTTTNTAENKKIELEAFMSLGYSMSIGIDISLGKFVSFFAEAYANAASFEVKKGTITEWSQTNASGNTSDNLNNMDTRDRVTEYKKNYSVDSNNPSTSNQNSPTEAPTFSLPSSNAGFSAGFVFNF